jgi:hypothetical protein
MNGYFEKNKQRYFASRLSPTVGMRRERSAQKYNSYFNSATPLCYRLRRIVGVVGVASVRLLGLTKCAPLGQSVRQERIKRVKSEDSERREGSGGSSHLAPLLKKLRRIKTQIQVLHQENSFFSPRSRGMRAIR